jgi:outer membrane protein assembly factor BamD
MKRLSILVLVLVLAGCSSPNRVRYTSPQEAYERGMERFEAGRYDVAIEYFQGAFDFGRSHEWAADAQLQLAHAYRASEQYLLAANEYTRFTQIYRSDPRVADAEYLLAMTYYDRSPAYQLDQTDTERAIRQFRLFMTRYPDHERTADAAERIEELREKLGKKAYYTAKLYERRELFQAAAVSFEAVFDRYYDTEWADDALLGAMQAYLEYGKLSVRDKRRERFGKGVDSYERLIQIFPDSPILKDAEAVYVELRAELDRLNQPS